MIRQQTRSAPPRAPLFPAASGRHYSLNEMWGGTVRPPQAQKTLDRIINAPYKRPVRNSHGLVSFDDPVHDIRKKQAQAEARGDYRHLGKWEDDDAPARPKKTKPKETAEEPKEEITPRRYAKAKPEVKLPTADEGRVLYSLPLELRVLRTLCTRGEVPSYLNAGVTSEHLYGPTSRQLLRIIRKFAKDNGKRPTWDTILQDINTPAALRRLMSESEEVAPYKTMSGAQQAFKQLDEYRSARAIYTGIQEVATEIQSTDHNISDLLAKMVNIAAIAQPKGRHNDVIFGAGQNTEADDLVERVFAGEIATTYVPTGIESFDSVNSGFPRGAAVVIGGATSSGKSHVCLSMGETQARLGHRVSFIPLEMTKEETFVRLLAKIAGLDSRIISLDRWTEEDKEHARHAYERWTRVLHKRGGSFIIHERSGNQSTTALLDDVYVSRPDVIYIDYIGLMGDASGEDQWRKLGDIVGEGKRFAVAKNCCVVFACQVDETGRIRYSQTIKEHANIAFVFVATDESRKGGYLDIKMLKGRGQLMYNFRVNINYATSEVTDPPHWKANLRDILLNAMVIDQAEYDALSEEAQDRKAANNDSYNDGNAAAKEGKVEASKRKSFAVC